MSGFNFFFLPGRQREAFGSRVWAPPCVTWVECPANIQHSSAEQTFTMLRRKQVLTKNTDGNHIKTVICPYMLRDFLCHAVDLVFECIIRYSSLFIIANCWHKILLHDWENFLSILTENVQSCWKIIVLPSLGNNN